MLSILEVRSETLLQVNRPAREVDQMPLKAAAKPRQSPSALFANLSASSNDF